jgi:hypothetical protein
LGIPKNSACFLKILYRDRHTMCYFDRWIKPVLKELLSSLNILLKEAVFVRGTFKSVFYCVMLDMYIYIVQSIYCKQFPKDEECGMRHIYVLLCQKQSCYEKFEDTREVIYSQTVAH